MMDENGKFLWRSTDKMIGNIRDGEGVLVVPGPRPAQTLTT